MSAKHIKNITASVRQRLLDRATERNEDYNFVLIRYVLERLLYRLSKSKYADEFVLKGALLFQLWAGTLYRSTKDLDLLGRGESSVARFEQIFKEICGQAVEDDGLKFDLDSIQGEEIKEEQEYGGIRMKLHAYLGDMPIRGLQIDIGFGDALTPEAQMTEYPSLLDLPEPHVLAYPKESVVSEKYQALVSLGMANSRMKDYYDLWMMARLFDFEGPLLCDAIKATFERRRTALPNEIPTGLTEEFYEGSDRQAQWRGFVRRGNLMVSDVELPQVAESIRGFLIPPTEALTSVTPFNMHWTAKGPWR